MKVATRAVALMASRAVERKLLAEAEEEGGAVYPGKTYFPFSI